MGYRGVSDRPEKRVERLRPNLIGKKAAEMVMNSFAGHYVSLYDVKADFTIVYFWEPDCGHCKEATPLLKNTMKKTEARELRSLPSAPSLTGKSGRNTLPTTG